MNRGLPKRALFSRLCRRLKHAMQDIHARPELVLGSTLSAWCDEAFPALPQPRLAGLAEGHHAPEVTAFANFLKNEDILDATYWLASAYAQLVTVEHRKCLAMYFTPPSLTKRLLDDVSTSGIDFATRSFGDPACGGGAFLVPIAMRMRDALRLRGLSPADILKHVQNHLFGLEKDAVLCELSKHFLLMALYDEVVATGAPPAFNVHQRDALQQDGQALGKLDVVVCNPPFRKMPAVEVECYSGEFAEVIEAQPNLYALFVVQCVRLLAPGGTCALVTPTSFLSGRSFSKLRTFLLARTRVLSLGVVKDRHGVFMDVEQGMVLTLARREGCGHVPAMQVAVSVVSRAGDYLGVGRCPLPNSGAAWPIPRAEHDGTLIQRLAQSPARLTDYGYKARIGAFVWNRDTRTTYVSAKSAARARGGTAVPLLWSSDIRSDGELLFSGRPKANKEPCFVNLGAKNHPSVVRNPSVLLQRVTSSEQPRRLVAAPVPTELIKTYGGFVGENHTVILEQMAPEPALSLRQLAQLLGTPTVDRYFRCISGSTNVSTFELNQLRLPDPSRLTHWLAQGHDMASAARKALE